VHRYASVKLRRRSGEVRGRFFDATEVQAPLQAGGLTLRRDPSYFLRDFVASDCIRPFMLGAAALTLDFSFFGFFASRFPRCSRLAMA
jgi:hypothetical protein